MKYLLALVGIGMTAFGQAAHAQNVLSTYTQAETTVASAASYDYRYTRHSISSGGRGSRPYVFYSWDRYQDQLTTAALGAAAQVTAQGTFYGPTYAATAKVSRALTNTPTQAILTVKYGGATAMTTPLSAHQSVSVTAQPGETFTFTITHESNVRVSIAGDPNGVFRLSGYGTVLLGPLYGTSGPVSLDTPLAPGTYWVTDGLTYTSGINIQLGTSLNPGTTSTTWGYTMTVTPTESGGSGGSDD